MGDEYTETVDTSSDMDTSEDFSEDVSADSNDIADDIPEDVPEDSSFDSDDMADDIPEDIPEDVPEDSSADSEDIADDIPEDIPEDAPEDSSSDSDDIADDIPEDIPEDVPEDPSSDSDGMADDIPEDIPEDVPEDSSSDSDDMANDIPEDIPEDAPEDSSADSEDIADDIPEDIPEDAPEDSSADSEDTADDIPEDIPEDVPADTQNDDANETSSGETEDTTSDASADEQPTDSQDDMADEAPSDETEDTTSDISADERPTDTQNDMERNADTQKDAFLQLSDYMNEHNYGPDDFATYSQDPEWQRLHSNAYPNYTPPEASSADTQENSFRQLSEYMNEHNYGPDDFATYSQDPEWQQLHSNAYPDYVLPEDSSKGSDIANEAPAHPNEDTAFNISTDTQDDINDKIPTAETEDTVLNTQNDMNSDVPMAETGNTVLDTQNDMNSDVPTAEIEDTVLDIQDDMNSDVPTAETEDTVLDTQDDMNSDGLMAETEDTVLDTQGDMDSDVPTSETEDIVPDAYDDQTHDDMDNESPTMEDGANDTNWNPFKPKKETKNSYNWNKNEWEATPVVRDMPPKSNADSKEYSSMVDALEKANVEYRPIQLAEQGRTEQDIINRLSGGDMTKGSCSSLALAYAGNKAGYDVLDFRDGDSRSFFSSRNSIQTVADMPGVNSTVLQGTNDIATANQLLSGIQAGKEYYLATGGHAAIVKRDGNGYQYLELQHPSNGNGWHNLNDYMLRQRFGCKDSRPYECSSYLMDVDSLANSSEFRNLLGYINTASSSQKKGVYGNVR